MNYTKYFFLRLGVALAIQTVFVIGMIYFDLQDSRIVNGFCTLVSMLSSFFIVDKYFKKDLDIKK